MLEKIVAAIVVFVIGYILGSYRQREFIKREVSESRWDWMSH